MLFTRDLLTVVCFFTVHDCMRYYPDDFGRRVSSTHQSSQTFFVNIHIVQLLYIF